MCCAVRRVRVARGASGERVLRGARGALVVRVVRLGVRMVRAGVRVVVCWCASGACCRGCMSPRPVLGSCTRALL